MDDDNLSLSPFPSSVNLFMLNDNSSSSDAPLSPILLPESITTDNNNEEDDNFSNTSYSSDDFYGRNVIDAAPTDSDEQGWYEYLNKSDPGRQ